MLRLQNLSESLNLARFRVALCVDSVRVRVVRVLPLPIVCPSGRHHLFVCLPARPTLSRIIPSPCLHASDMWILLAH